MMMRLCSICARGGSKGIKSKNLVEVAGLPLIAHTVLQAKRSGLFSHIAISSDSLEIIEAAKTFGADIAVVRPLDMASDTAAKLPAIQHCLEEVELKTNKKFDIVCDLDATSPLRSVEDILGAVALMEEKKSGNVITGTVSRRSPYFNLVEASDDGKVVLSKIPSANVVRRQDAPKTYDMNASIYVWTAKSLKESQKVLTETTWIYEMPEERSLDIDSPLDLKIVQFLMGSKNETI